MKNISIENLKETALRVRERVIKMSAIGGCFLGAALSCADLLVYLYKVFLNVKKENLNNLDRDYFFLSKGHVVSVLYSVFVEVGFINEKRLENHLSTNDYIYWQPNTNINGVEFHAGSLGHLLSIACGVAEDIKLRKGKNKVVVMLGDGELNEGSNWEAILYAGSRRLNNLIAIVDRNKLQANVETEKLIKLEPLNNKFRAFGWEVRKTDGNNFEKIHNCFSLLPKNIFKPIVIIAETTRGKGVPSIESRVDKWFAHLTEEEANSLISELYKYKK